MRSYLLYLLILFPFFLSAQKFLENDSIANSIILKENKSSEDIDQLLALVNDYDTHAETQTIILKELKKDKKWNYPEWKPYRILDSALVHFNNRAYEKALPYFKKHISLGDKNKQVFSMNQSLGLARICFGNRHEDKLDFYQSKLDYYLENGPFENTPTCYHGMANAYYAMANYSLAIRNYIKAAEAYKKFDNSSYGNELAVIGTVYENWGNKIKAREYLELALPVLKQENYYSTECFALNSLIKIYREHKELDKASTVLEEVFQIYDNFPFNNDLIGYKIVSIQEKLHFYLDIQKSKEALAILEEAKVFGDSLNIKMRSNSGFYEIDYGYYRYHFQMENWKKAEAHLLQAISLAKQNDLSALEIKYLKEAVIFYNQIGNGQKSSDYSIDFIHLSDSINTQNSQNLLASYEFEKLDMDKALELNNMENQRKENMLYFILFSSLLSVFAIGLFFRMRYIRKTRKIIEKEKEQSEKLLLNILPKKIAEELKATGDVTPELIQDATILFTDFIGFTSLAGQLDSKALVDELNICFGAFDDILKQYNIEKIKTMGDAYMAVGGLQGAPIVSAKNTISTALKMQEFISERKKIRNELGKPSFEMRVGIHTGSITAGVVGKDKFQFDIWGDAVNIASRMESYGKANQVNISEATYALLKNDASFTFTNRERKAVKGMGEMKMFFINSTL